MKASTQVNKEEREFIGKNKSTKLQVKAAKFTKGRQLTQYQRNW